MSYRLVELVFDAAPVRDPRTLVVLLALAEWSKDDGVCWHGIEKIMQRARCAQRTAESILKRLAEPDANGYVLLHIRRGATTKFWALNIALLERLRSERKGQGNMWKSGEDAGGHPPEKKSQYAAGCAPDSQAPAPKTPGAADSDAVGCALTIKEPEEPELKGNRNETPAVSFDVGGMVEKLAGGAKFPPGHCVPDRAEDARRQFLEKQATDLRRKAAMA